MNIQAGDILKWHKSNNINGIAIVVRTYGTHDDMFDVMWLKVNGFVNDREASIGYNKGWLSQSVGWSKLS